MRSVALIGPDGAGKSTVAREVVRGLSVPARYLYMGVNLESSRLMLPTTRLALEFKRARGRRAQMTAKWSAGTPAHAKPNLLRGAYSALRLLFWTAEEWYRALVAQVYMRRGEVVVFDRHFVYDYHASHVAPHRGRTLTARLHGEMLRRLYPRPDLVICLDAPAELLRARKHEHTVESLERRRREYLALASITPDFVVVDATQPLPAIVNQISAMLEARLQ